MSRAKDAPRPRAAAAPARVHPLLQRLQRSADAVGTALFAALFLVFVVQIVARFGFDKPLPWTDEVAVCLYVWVILWAAATMVPEREHVMFDLLGTPPARARGGRMRVAGNAMLGGLAAWALPACADYVWFMRREGTAVLGVPFAWCSCPSWCCWWRWCCAARRNVWRALRGWTWTTRRCPAHDGSALWWLGGVLVAAMLMRMPIGFSMIAGGIAYLVAKGQDLGWRPSRSATACTTATYCWRCRCSCWPPT